MTSSRSELPRFVDARGLLKSVEGDPHHAKLTKAIRRAVMAQSCVADLAQSADSLDALEKLLVSPRKSGTIERTTTESSLLMNAVVLYARATSTSRKRGDQGERGSIQIDSELTTAERIDHNAIIEVRNRAFAHVYVHETVGGDVWDQDALFLVETENGWRPASVTKRIQFHKPTKERLRRQLPRARAIVLAKFHKHTNALIALTTDQPIPLANFESNLIDPTSFFGSLASVENALAGMSKGWASGLV